MTSYRREAADAIHNSTKHGTEPQHPDRLIPYRRLDPANAPARFKEYRGLSVTPLPRRLITSSLPATSVLSGEEGKLSSGGLNASLVATLLYLSAGVTRTVGPSESPIFFRAGMSAGNLHPVELYVVAGPEVDGIGAGVHHFAPFEFGLTELRSGDVRGAVSIEAPLAFVLTGLVWRTTWKYGERGWRHLYWDAGTMLANLLAAAASHGLSPRILLGFDDTAVARLVGIDGADEVPLALVTFGAEDPDTVRLGQHPNPLSPDVAPVARHPVRLPLLVEAQAEGALRTDEVADWRRAGAEVVGAADSKTDAPPTAVEKQTIEQVILARGSTRVMLHESVAEESLTWPMAASARTIPWDIGGGTLLSHYVSVHATDGLAAGAYRWREGNLELLSESAEARAIAAAICLDQPLGGDSAYTVFHHAPLDPILKALGSRGYRAAQLEAGVASGRLALCAFALGLGATGLTFYDDLAAQYFQTESAPMLVTSVGPSATPPAPSGSPGEPVALRRYDRVMSRMTTQLRRRSSRT